VIYASAKEGYARYELEDSNMDIIPLLETIIKNVKDPGGDATKPFSFSRLPLSTITTWDVSAPERSITAGFRRAMMFCS
jgi:predicted membrane GTPase involved in stress response